MPNARFCEAESTELVVEAGHMDIVAETLARYNADANIRCLDDDLFKIEVTRDLFAPIAHAIDARYRNENEFLVQNGDYK